MAGVRNGADVLLKSLFIEFGGRDGLIAFGVLLIGTGAALVWRDLQRGGSIQPRYFLLMAAESVAYALHVRAGRRAADRHPAWRRGADAAASRT